jgi:hypothetical protein
MKCVKGPNGQSCPDFRNCKLSPDVCGVPDRKSQTRASAKWAKSKGLVSKSYKLPGDLVEAFAEACEENEISQSGQLIKYMRGYCKRAGIEI